MPDNARPTILLTGAGGQVGWELIRTLAPAGIIVAHNRNTMNLEDLKATREAVRATRPSLIVNAAAYTNVDRAEGEIALAHRINAEAPGVLAEEAARADAVLIHYSTDYVFDGSLDRAYTEADHPAPINVYGASKLAGEAAIMRSGAAAYVFRLSSVFGLRGQNFLRTMQRLADQSDPLRVVADQRGTPTWARLVAEATTMIASEVLAARRARSAPPPCGVYHMAGPDSATWHEFAEAIIAASGAAGHRLVEPITSADYRARARRPASATLDSTKLAEAFGVRLPGWRDQLALCLASENT